MNKVNYDVSVTKKGVYVDEKTKATYNIEANISQTEDDAVLNRLTVNVLKEGGAYNGQISLQNGNQSMTLPFDNNTMTHLTVFNDILKDLKNPTETKKEELSEVTTESKTKTK